MKLNAYLGGLASSWNPYLLRPGWDRTCGESFGALLSQSWRSADSQVPEKREAIYLRLLGEKGIYSGGRPGKTGMQTVYVEYTADSTQEDPIVQISGTADSGKFDFICHINDIDPTRASYAEMAALYAHLRKSGACPNTPGLAREPVLPFGCYEYGDFMEKQDFISRISALTTSRQFGVSGILNAKALLGLYEDFIYSKRAG